MKKHRFILSVALIINFVSLISCDSKKDDPEPLYQQIGGEPVVTAIIDQAITNIITDSRINFFFAALATDSTRAQSLRANLIDQLGELSGGSQEYRGRSMIVTHTGLNITDGQFNAFIEDFTNAINSQNIPEAQRIRLVQLYQNLKGEIVGQ